MIVLVNVNKRYIEAIGQSYNLNISVGIEVCTGSTRVVAYQSAWNCSEIDRVNIL